jgi:DNA-binding transcriptional LysR family regulator
LVSYPRASRTIEAIPWREEPMVLVCAPRHRLAARRAVALEELAGENVIGFDSDLTIRREIDRVLQLHRAEVCVTMEFDNIETIKRAIEIDAGVALLPEPTVLREVEAGTLVKVPLATDELVRPLGIIHRRGKELGSTARRFIELLQSEGQSVPRISLAGDAATADASNVASTGNGAGNGAANGQANGHHATPAQGKKGSSENGSVRDERLERVKAK